MRRDSFFFKIQNSKQYNSIRLFFRNIRTKRGIDNYKKNFSFTFNKGRVILLIIVSIFLVVVIANINKYIEINFTPYLEHEDLNNRPLVLSDAKDINTLVIGFDDTQNNYKFINMLAIVNLDYQTASIKIYNINPNYLVNINNNKTTLKTAYNYLTSSNYTRMTDLLGIVENLSAIRIDRYVAFDYSNLPELINLSSLNIKSDKSYRLGDTFISEGENLTGSKLATFVSFSQNPDDEALKRQSIFLRTFFDNLRDNLTLYKFFLNSSEFSKIIHTNFTKDEFIRFVMNVESTDSSILTGYASSKLTLNDLSKINLESGVEHSDMLLDEDISNLFRSIPIIKEQAKIEVFNATEKSGVAYNLKRKFENTGITVIKTGNYPDTVTENTLYLPKNNPDNFVNTIRFIRSVLRDKLKIVYGDYKYNYSGDMILVIGN